MPHVGGEGLAGQQVNRYGIAVEGVHNENVKLLRGLAFQREASVTRDDGDVARALAKVVEFGPRQGDYGGVEFIEAKGIAAFPVGRERARAQSDEAHTATASAGEADG